MQSNKKLHVQLHLIHFLIRSPETSNLNAKKEMIQPKSMYGNNQPICNTH